MSYYIRSLEQARAIITAYERCSSCDACPLHTPEGWRCSYLHDCATRYIKRHAEDGEKTEEFDIKEVALSGEPIALALKSF